MYDVPRDANVSYHMARFMSCRVALRMPCHVSTVSQSSPVSEQQADSKQVTLCAFAAWAMHT